MRPPCPAQAKCGLLAFLTHDELAIAPLSLLPCMTRGEIKADYMAEVETFR
jgi:hypothetical protein